MNRWLAARLQGKIFYGWIVVGAAFVCLFISVGFLFYAYSVFLPVLSREFGDKRFGPSMCLAVMNASIGFFAPILGRAIEGNGMRRLMTWGAISMGIGFIAMSQVTAIWQMFFIFATFLGVGASMVGQLPSSTLVANWFVHKRGTALGIATMGVSMSGVVMVPVTSKLIDFLGWRHTFVVFGVVAFVIVLPVVRLLIVTRPEDLGMQPDAATLPIDPAAFAADPANAAWSTKAAFRNVNFWVITYLIAFNFFCMSGTLIHMPAFGLDLGLSRMQAGLMLSTGAAIGVLGKVFFGYVADWVDTRFAMLLSMIFQAIAIAVLPFTTVWEAREDRPFDTAYELGSALHDAGLPGAVQSNQKDNASFPEGVTEATQLSGESLDVDVFHTDSYAAVERFIRHPERLAHDDAAQNPVVIGRSPFVIVVHAEPDRGMTRRLVAQTLPFQSYWLLLAVGGMFGLGMGGIVPLWGSFVGEYFGRKSFGRIMGLMSPFMVPIQVSGVPFAGFMFDWLGGYTVVFRIYLCVYIVTAGLLLLLDKRRINPLAPDPADRKP